MLDESGSVNSANWLKEEQFAKEIAKEVEVGDKAGRASVITFNSNSLLRIKFKDHLNYSCISNTTAV